MKVSLANYLDRLVRTLPAGAGVAYFDLDRTLIDGYSLTAMAMQQLLSGALSVRRTLDLAIMFAGYGLGTRDYAQMLQRTVDDIKGMPEAELIYLGERTFDERLADRIYREGHELIATHLRLGHEVVMVTAATRYQAAPIASFLGIRHLRCTELEIVDGKVSGKVTPCYGVGKVDAARGFAALSGTSLTNAYFYTDSQEDLPLLQIVGHPVVVNGKSKLRRIGQARGWPELNFTKTGAQNVPRTA